jgi:hypothetical protein
MLKNLVTLSLVITFLAACSATPKVLEVDKFGDDKLSCDEIATNIDEAEFYKKQARKDDNFQFRYLWVPTGTISAYNFNDAESAAIARKEKMEKLAQAKGCASSGQAVKAPSKMPSNVIRPSVDVAPMGR